jgi:hypothetical protein
VITNIILHKSETMRKKQKETGIKREINGERNLAFARTAKA